ncbi:hypothetical protein [Actinoplanes xinjiangensis]|uniref:Uncharacterized protein n=1 Tax=Actinoplanes xinjiangensis TaxID=512350 RepID=A0A316EJE9_9ACTN|nr:hypothetical protein [Actinoplanes xinjiangensis]PWK30788.1 hypothetical protein BC793_13610 [Actinoplanes xinjiangensis]GIF44233.1 hypothetical protein Axi01nite_85440 [Actinoplanes xinjiangensis]
MRSGSPDEAVSILLDGQERGGGGPSPGESMAGPVELFHAQGMVMIQIGGTLAEAMARIRAYAYTEDRRLIDVDRDAIERNVRLDQD